MDESTRKPEAVVDLRDSTLAAAAQRGSIFEFGFPTTCPACSGRGYLDHIDPFRRVQFEHCTTCFTKWETTEDELLSLDG